MKSTKVEREEAIERLRDLCPKGAKVWTVLRAAAPSGMSRSIDCVTFLERDGYPLHRLWLSRLMATAGIAGTWDPKRECLRVQGGGMDMGYHTVESLSYALYGEPNAFDTDWI